MAVAKQKKEEEPTGSEDVMEIVHLALPSARQRQTDVGLSSVSLCPALGTGFGFQMDAMIDTLSSTLARSETALSEIALLRPCRKRRGCHHFT